MPRFANTAFALVAVFLLLVPLVTSADTGTVAACEDGSSHAFLRLTTSATPFDGCTVVMPSVISTVEIWAVHVAAKKIRFSIQQPSFGAIVAESYNFPATGTLSTGIELDFGGCEPQGDTLLGTLTVILLNGTVGGCIPWQIAPGCEIVDCDDNTRPAEPRYHEFSDTDGCCSYIDCPSLPPTNLYPADGTIEVPLDVALSWSPAAAFVNVRISTDPACYTGQTFHLSGAGSNTLSPDFLLANTTYYWQVGWSDGIECGGTSAIYSFKTIAPLPTDEETWGRIKALYR